MTGPVLRLDGVSRHFGATVAVRDLDLVLAAGTVHSLVGENGAGKSTAGKIAAGVVAPSRGRVELDGTPRSYTSARQAEQDGVVLVPQELLLYDHLPVLENLFVGRPRPRGRTGLLSRDAMRDRAARAFARLDLDLDLDQVVGVLSPGSKQMVTIARALLQEARVLVLDEPTAALDEWEARRLLQVVDGLRRDGVAVLYVSHRLHEVMAVSDTVSVMRDGALVATGPVAEFDQDRLVEQMLGREMAARRRTTTTAAGSVALRARGLGRAGEFSDVDLDLRRGEIVGLGGIVGAGRTELAQTLFGLRRPDHGSIEIDGEEVRLRGVADALSRGLAYVPEERQSQGLCLSLTVADNAVGSVLARLAPRGVLGPRRVRAEAERCLQGLRLRGRLEDRVDSLSGGNQQKVLLAKWLATRPQVVLLDEPTRGIDIGARSEIYAIVDELAAQGCAVLLISSDLQELLQLSDRVVVMREGRVAGCFAGEQLTERVVGRAALGVDSTSGPDEAVAS